jgi:CRISPR/Cas system endoribonuclease Cas6 (RAMP superfamily)
VYRWVASVDPEASQQIHDSNGLKPLSVAPLVVSGEKEAHILITSLDDRLANSVRAAVLLHSEPVRLKAKKTHHSYTLNNEARCVARADWKDLVAKAVPSTQWHVDLISPTACKVQKRLAPAPSAVAYFNSWHVRWKEFSPVGLPVEDILTFVSERVDIIELRGHTVEVPITLQERPYPGFIGKVVFAVNKPVFKDIPYLKALDTLAEFAAYSGTGVQGMRGMGVTQTKSLATLARRS